MTETDTNRRRFGVESCCKAARQFCKNSATIPARIYQHLVQCGGSTKHSFVGYDPFFASRTDRTAFSGILGSTLVKGNTPTCKAYVGFDSARILAEWRSA